MNVVRTHLNKTKGIKHISQLVNELIRENFGHIINEIEPYYSTDLKIIFNTFKHEVCSIRFLDYYVDSTHMYTNEIGTYIIVNIKNKFDIQPYRISFNIGR